MPYKDPATRHARQKLLRATDAEKINARARAARFRQRRRDLRNGVKDPTPIRISPTAITALVRAWGNNM